jgi:hypothetical protein
MPDFTATFTKDAENFTAVQKVWTETMECTHRDLITLFEAEAKLGTDFMSRLREAKTIPEVALAYQEWMSARRGRPQTASLSLLADTKTRSCL